MSCGVRALQSFDCGAMGDAMSTSDEPMSTWGRCVVWLLVYSVIAGAVAFLAKGQSSDFGMLGEIFLGVLAGWAAFAFSVVAYAFAAIFIGLLTVSVHDTPVMQRVYRGLKYLALAIGFAGVSLVFVPWTYDGFTANRFVSAQELYMQCMTPEERTVREYDSSRCEDGWRTPSTGKGRCSHHGGVDWRLIERRETYQPLTATECKKKAWGSSWID